MKYKVLINRQDSIEVIVEAKDRASAKQRALDKVSLGGGDVYDTDAIAVQCDEIL